MSGTQPVAVYALKVPPGEMVVPAAPDFAAMFRVSMAAIDPTEEISEDVKSAAKTPRATLKMIRTDADMLGLEDDSDDLEDEDEDMEDAGSDDDDEVNGGPSDLSKSPKAKNKSLVNGVGEDGEESDDERSGSSDEEAAAKLALKKLIKGKDKAGDDDDMSDDSLDEEQEHYQQPLDLVIGEEEQIFFKVDGTHTIHLTGNYVIPMGEDSTYGDEDDNEFDLSPDEDELEDYDSDEEEDELDGLEDPRVMEVDTDDDGPAPKLVKVKPTKEEAPGKGKNKRPAEDSPDDEEEANLDDIMAKSLKPAGADKVEEPKLSKNQLKKLKKQKKNDGQAAEVGTVPQPEKQPALKKEPSTNGEKKVQFAENLEQGPTPSPSVKSEAKPDAKSSSTASLGVKKVSGVTLDDRKLGKGPAAKKGDKVGVRYIGKLATSGKVFDGMALSYRGFDLPYANVITANKKGPPFAFKVGAGEVIKGWDTGIVGMSVGGERRITIPANQAYGAKGSPPDIPPNSVLVFDVKMLEIK
ncbi:MAG: hypothetical protein Q9227_007992 [Pyrenula ochraceoflavens]